jgi:hypothetical protein
MLSKPHAMHDMSFDQNAKSRRALKYKKVLLKLQAIKFAGFWGKQ